MTQAIAALIEIMNETDAPLRRRIEAAEGLLTFEADLDVAEQAKAFLVSIFEDAEQHVDDRLDACRIARRAEARKITQPTVTADDGRANREQCREIEIARRRVAMINAGLWPPPKDWMDDLRSENYVPPRRPINTTTDTQAERVKRARLSLIVCPSMRP